MQEDFVIFLFFVEATGSVSELTLIARLLSAF